MGMIRKTRLFGIETDDMLPIDAEFITTSDGLLRFAEANEINKCPLDVKNLAEKIGIIICQKPFNEDISGHLRLDGDKWTITVNKLHHPLRKRYTIAHEMAHYFLHRNEEIYFEDQIFFRGLERSAMEWEANKFASEILMPETEFKRLLSEGTKGVEDLAKKFEVSTLALRIRAKDLGFTGHGLD